MGGLKMPSLLIMEDEPSITAVLKEFLGEKGYEIFTAYDGITGINILRSLERIPSLVIVDLNMPGMSGKDVINAIRYEERFKDMPVIIITGTVYNSEEFPAKESYQDLLEKPFDLNELLKKVSKLAIE
jgi:DNA-binding response OmpR family regulator